ncbi:MAG: NUDIX domain-containing protein [Candidatus Micrarchaeota archaeon]|nr:NUDIX domain-containing protein [Candidatus Micrarchaeota archaeon]
MVRKRRRGAAIVDTSKGILVVSGRKRLFILPGGGARKGESRRKAAMRELREETGLKPISSHYLFRYVGYVHKAHGGGYFQDHNKVFLVKVVGKARPRHEVRHIEYYREGSEIRISRVTEKIINRYYQIKFGNNEMK